MKVSRSGSPGNLSGKIYHFVLKMYFLCLEKRRKEETDEIFAKISAGICVYSFVFGGSCFLAKYFVFTVADITESTGVRNLEAAVCSFRCKSHSV